MKTWADATPEERRGAMRMAALWTSSEVEGLTEYGAFSEANLGLPAVEYFPLEAYKKLKDPNSKWKWKEGNPYCYNTEIHQGKCQCDKRKCDSFLGN